MPQIHLVTGAFGYSGGAIARELLSAGRTVRTLTRSPDRPHDLGDSIEVFPFEFEDPAVLCRALEGVDVLYNTYWVRFSGAGFSQEEAVRNTRVLFQAARESRVGHVVHVSIDSPYEYFRGKARLEEALVETGLSHTILRPAVLFGGADILIHNIVWMLRRFPFFAIFGDGNYQLQPIQVDDFARLAVESGQSATRRVIDAIGPETFRFRDLVRTLGEAIGRPRRLISVSPRVGLLTSWLLGLFVRDVIVTREEIGALMDNLLVTDSAPAGTTRLSEWAREQADEIGLRYSSDLARRRDRRRSYR